MSDPLYIFNSMSLCVYIYMCVSVYLQNFVVFVSYFGYFLVLFLTFAGSQSEIVIESLLASSNLRSSMPTQQIQSLRYIHIVIHLCLCFFFPLYRFLICSVIKVSFLFYPSKQRYSVFISNVLVLWIYEESLWRHGTLEENLHTLVLISMLCFTSTANMIYTF